MSLFNFNVGFIYIIVDILDNFSVVFFIFFDGVVSYFFININFDFGVIIEVEVVIVNGVINVFDFNFFVVDVILMF